MKEVCLHNLSQLGHRICLSSLCSKDAKSGNNLDKNSHLKIQKGRAVGHFLPRSVMNVVEFHLRSPRQRVSIPILYLSSCEFVCHASFFSPLSYLSSLPLFLFPPLNCFFFHSLSHTHTVSVMSVKRFNQINDIDKKKWHLRVW